MRKLALTLTAAAACTLGASLTDRAQAGALGGADGIRAALDQVRIVEPVHCLPGRVHRRSPPYDGCYRTSRRYYAPQPYAYAPYPYGYRQHYYGSPGISFSFGSGRRHSGYGFGWGW
jgi:hypothetical protein